ncbi:MAG: GFA family protein, partial [Gemmatimonadota bacterium]
MTAAPASAVGSCLCGAVGFEFELPPKWVAHCHCTQCQRAHGAAFVTWVGVDEALWRVDDSQHAL